MTTAAPPTSTAEDASDPEEVGGDVILLARQAILDSANGIRGHELLFRREDGTGWPIEDEDKATAHVLVAAFADLSLGALTSGARAWVNTPGSFLLKTDLAVLPKDRVVLEVLERDQIDAALYARAVELGRSGYPLALDDFMWRDDAVRLLEAATYVKLDVRELGLAGVAEHVRRLAEHDVEIVGEKVETAEERDALLAMGIGLFQGYFFERPRLVHGRPAPSAAIARLRTATSLTASSTFEEVEQVVRHDPGISVRLLRYINSAAVSLRSTVGSLRQALMLVGANTVRQWLLLVLMGDLGGARPAVLSAGLVRARLCETLARDMGLRNLDGAFVVGLLSVCDALLDTTLDEIIPSLPLSDELKAAIVFRQGELGDLLDTAVALERGNGGGADAKRAYALYSSVQWANAQLSEFAGPAAA